MEAFERLNRKLNALAGTEPIGADDIFETISLFLDGVNELSGKKGVGAYGIKHDEKQYATSLLKTLNAAMLSYESNTDSLAGISERQRKNYETALSKLAGVKDELTALMPTLEKLESTSRQLEGESAALETKRTRAEELERSIARLTEEITKLNAISIENMEKEEKALADDCEARQERISALEGKLAEASGRVEELTAAEKEKTAALEKAAAEKAELEGSLERLIRELAEYQAWREDFLARHEETTRTLREHRARMDAVKNAWGVISQRPELPEILSVTGGLQAANRQINSFAELETWFRDMGDGLEKALSAYAETYNALLSAVETETNG